MIPIEPDLIWHGGYETVEPDIRIRTKNDWGHIFDQIVFSIDLVCNLDLNIIEMEITK